MNRQNILIFLPANEFSEEEFLIVKNSFEKSIKKIFIASDTSGLCKGENGLKIKADVNLFNIHPSNFASIIIIGGSGIIKYWDNEVLQSKLKQFFEKGKVIAAICAAPIILGRANLLKNTDATCYPQFTNELIQTGANLQKAQVVSVGKIITASGASVAAEFCSKIISKINKL